MLDRDNITDICCFYHPDTSFSTFINFLKEGKQQEQWDKRQMVIKKNQILKDLQMVSSQSQKANLITKYYTEQERNQAMNKQKSEERIKVKPNSIAAYLRKIHQTQQIRGVKKQYILQFLAISVGIITFTAFWKKIPGVNLLRIPGVPRAILATGLISLSFFTLLKRFKQDTKAVIAYRFQQIKPHYIRFLQDGDIRSLIPKAQLI